MNRIAKILAALAMSAATATAGIAPVMIDKNPAPPPPSDPCAGPISYTNVELLYAYTDFDEDAFDNGDGFDIRFEYEAMKSFYVTASVDYDSFDYSPPNFDGQRIGSASVETWTLTLGIGGHLELTENIHLAGDAGFVYTDIESDYSIDATVPRRGLSDSETGWFVRPHIRAKWGCLTVHAGGAYSDLGDNDEWTLYGRLYYQVAAQWDLTAGLSSGEDADVYSAGVRYRF